jgi:polysaccharide export outer membrane protein
MHNFTKRVLAVRRFTVHLSGAGLSLLLMPLCCPKTFAQVEQPRTSTPELIQRPPADIVTPQIAPGDVVSVNVFNTPELTGEYEVNRSGGIRLPGTSLITVGGLTTFEAADAIEAQLKKSDVMIDPQAKVMIAHFAPKNIGILGEVNKPGVYVLSNDMSLSTALAMAGGVTPKEGSTITITHRSGPNRTVTIRVDSQAYAGEPVLLRDGDTVFVSSVGKFYVIGDVNHPGEFYLTNDSHPLRVLAGIAMAQGLKDTAKETKASIIRSNASGEATTIPLNLKRIAKNQVPDPPLEPFDIIVVPRSGFKQFQNVALPGITGAAANAAAIALVAR